MSNLCPGSGTLQTRLKLLIEEWEHLPVYGPYKYLDEVELSEMLNELRTVLRDGHVWRVFRGFRNENSHTKCVRCGKLLEDE